MFKSTPTQFQTIIFASSDTPNVGDHDGDMSESKLSERQQKILNLIKESPTITGRQMSETLSVSQRTIERDLSALQKKGVLKREGKDNNGVWISAGPCVEPADWFVYTRRFCQRFAPIFSILFSFPQR